MQSGNLKTRSKCVRPYFIWVIRLWGSVDDTHSSFKTFLFLRCWSKRRTSSSVGSCSGSIALQVDLNLRALSPSS